MSFTEFGRYTTLAEGCAVFSCLKAGGFEPYFQNYHYAHIAALEMLALGGLVIFVPENHLLPAREFLREMQVLAEKDDYDPIPPRKFGMWKRATIFGFSLGVWFLPLYFIPPKILVAITIGLSLVMIGLHLMTGLSTVWVIPLILFIPLIIWHAKYIALPNLQLQKD